MTVLYPNPSYNEMYYNRTLLYATQSGQTLTIPKLKKYHAEGSNHPYVLWTIVTLTITSCKHTNNSDRSLAPYIFTILSHSCSFLLYIKLLYEIKKKTYKIPNFSLHFHKYCIWFQ